MRPILRPISNLILLGITSVWFIAGAAALAAAEGPPASQPELLVDGGYEDRLHELFGGAQREITVIMFLATMPPDARPSHPVRRLLDHLIAVRKRGITVQVLLDAGAPPDAGRPSADVGAYLAAAGVPVRWDEDDRTTHAKVVIVDGRWCVLGSTNWSYSALRSNRETSVCCDSPALAAQLLAIFNDAWAKGKAVN